MLGLLSSQLAWGATTLLAKKTFEFSITSSLKGLSDVIKERFANSQQLQDTQAELEAKVRMLCLPVDLLAHYATRGNTALQEPLGVALGVLEEVEAFRQALVQQHVARAQDSGASPDAATASVAQLRGPPPGPPFSPLLAQAQDGGASPDAATASVAQLSRRLRELISRLDSLLPYLNLAISTAVLLNQGTPSPISYSRLMAASWHLRANPQPGAAVFALPEACWHEERQLTAAGPRMGEVFRLCSITVCRAASRHGLTTEAASASAAAAPGSVFAAAVAEAAQRAGSPLPTAAGPGGGGSAGGRHCGVAGRLDPGAPSPGAAGSIPASRFGYELIIEQDLEDGVYHEAGERPGTVRLQVSDIVAIDWETTQSLAQGENEYRPALVLHVWQNGGGAAREPPAAAAAAGVASEAGVAAEAPDPVSTPPAGPASGLPASRASSRRRAGACKVQVGEVAAADAAATPGSVAAAGTAGGVVTPVAAARLGDAGGVGGSIRRCAVICSLRSGGTGDSEGEDGEEGQDANSGSDASSDAGSDSDCGGPAAISARTGGALASATLQQDWQLLGELEFVIRLCMLESREQQPHHQVTDERILMSFQATSAPAGTASFRAAAPPFSAHEAGLQPRPSTAAAAARWRSAAAGAAHALSAGVEAVTAGVRQLSFTPAAGGAQGGTVAAAGGGEAPAGGSSRRTRSSTSKAGTRGFGSPVQ